MDLLSFALGASFGFVVVCIFVCGVLTALVRSNNRIIERNTEAMGNLASALEDDQ